MNYGTGNPSPTMETRWFLPVGDGFPVPASCFILLVRQAFMCFLLLTQNALRPTKRAQSGCDVAEIDGASQNQAVGFTDFL